MKKWGPGLMVTAAFIGPGTVTTASMAGAQYGYALVWALLFSILATLVLQEMTSRLGLVSGYGLADAIRNSINAKGLRLVILILIVTAIGIGNAAYQGGNLTGAAMGLSALVGASSSSWAGLIALLALMLLGSGKHHWVERGLITLVVMMSVVFIATAVVAGPDIGALFAQLTAPTLPSGSELMVIALVGTTVVPYNLFLHASTVARHRDERQPVSEALRNNRWDTGLSVGLGGLVTLAILSTSATAFFNHNAELTTATIAQQLEPLLGIHAQWFFSLGLLAAGLTSAITAPLAAAYAVCGAFQWPTDLHATRFRAVWFSVLLIGTVFAVTAIKPLQAILLAQAANGILLPFIAVFLLWIMNRSDHLGEHRNGILANLLGGIIVSAVTLLGVYKVISVF
ncbi:Nramp family divalent metal transporter [Aestuariibacter halophilus]|uniref:Nramp family divalent metal transporter n=1 Tax=Fluctibacter halophilus TaxID=226011 RepID=A0ABS8GB20_9ALTE|nr:Nramp family divalent metal transporter [Aestuariibacter halophilus]MCC2617271.1 Nramp family divalent metal transporter [Aestuariibacter halophilus]